MSKAVRLGRLEIGLVLLASSLAACGGGGANPAAGQGQLVVMITPTLPAGTTGALYQSQVEAQFVHLPGVYQITSGNLPPGVKLDKDTGIISGYPRQTGVFHLEIAARDGEDLSLPPGRDANFAEDRRVFDIVVDLGPPNILPQTPTLAVYRQGYFYQIDVAGGTPPFTFTQIGGSLPSGLTVSPAGVLGTQPTSFGASPYSVQVRVTDANGLTDVDSLSLELIVLPLTILTSSIPEAAVGFAYDRTIQLASSGGGAPITWSQKTPIAGEVLLSSIGMEITADGHLRNAAGFVGPTTVGTFTFTLAVTDEPLQEATRQFTLIVNPGPVLTSITPNRASSPGPFTATGLNFQPGAQLIFKPGATQTSVVATFVNASTLTFNGPVAKPVNGSGAVDVMVRNPDGGSHTRASAFIFPATTIGFGTKGFVSSALSSTGLSAADLNGDGRADVVHCGAASLTVYSGGATSTAAGLALLMNLGGSPLAFTSTTLDTGNFYDVKIADVNVDGKPDIVALGQTSVKTWLNGVSGNPLGTFLAGPVSTLPGGSSWPSELSIGRLNSDAIPDLAFGVPHYPSGNVNGRVYTMAGTGTGSFTALDSADSSIPNTYGVISLACVDTDGNGRAEVVAGIGMNPYSGPIVNTASTGSTGLFGSWSARGGTVTNPGYGSTTGVAAGDFLGTGVPAVVAAMTGSPNYSNVRLLTLFSGANLGTQATLAAPSTVSKCVTAIDADFDAPVDFAVTTAPGNILVYRGSTQAMVLTLDASAGAPAVSSPRTGRVTSADLNGDGRPDLLATTSYWAVESMAANYGSTYTLGAAGNGAQMGVVFYLNTSN